VTRSIPDAEDAVQEAIVRALETWPDRGRPDSPEAWLITVARNAHRDRARRAAREDLHGEPLELLGADEPWGAYRRCRTRGRARLERRSSPR